MAASSASRISTLDIPEGSVFGFLGPNGAGKTTTIRLLLDLLRPTAGSASICGFDCRRQSMEARACVGFLPGELPAIAGLTGGTFLRYLRDVGRRPVSERWLDHLRSRFDVSDTDLARPMRDYSQGMRRKLGVIQALMTEPRVVVLDEPTAGLDPLMVEAFTETIHELRGRGDITVFLSSHVLSEVERLCDHIGVVRRGRLIAVRSVAELRRERPQRVTVDFAAAVDGVSLPPDVAVIRRGERQWVRRGARRARPAHRLAERVAGAGSARRRLRARGFRARVLCRRRQPLMLGALVRRSLGRHRWLLAGVVALTAAFQIAIVSQAAALEQAQGFELMSRFMPGFVQRWMGDSLGALASFAGVIGFGYFHPIVVLVVALLAAFVASELAADVEDGQVDLLLTRPVARRSLVTRSALLVLLCPAAIVTVMIAATMTTVALVAPDGAAWPSVRVLSILGVNLAGVTWSVGGLSLALASLARRRAAAFGPAALLTVGLYLVNVLAASWRPARTVDLLSPFHYFQGPRILAGEFLPAADLMVLLTGTIALGAIAYWRFNARDL